LVNTPIDFIENKILKQTTMITNNCIQIKTDSGTAIIELNNIIHIEAISNYSKLYLNDTIRYANGAIKKCNTLVVAKVLKWFDDELTESGFVRIHRSHLVNKKLIKNVLYTKVQLSNMEWLSVSRRRKDCFKLD
jgi:two-component system, LytTR family, response regulator